MSHVFHRDPKRTYPMAVGADGAYLIDSSGALPRCLRRGGHTHTSFFTNVPMESFAAELVAGAPAGIDHAYFLSGGSEAVESALKLSR